MKMRAKCIAGLTAALVWSGQAPQTWAAHDCPEPRWTKDAPTEYYSKANPFLPGDLDMAQAQRLFLIKVPGETACASCHGPRGDGHGALASQFDPRPRDFTCRQTLAAVPDGQLFWIIRFGSPTASMPAHPKLSDAQIWQLVLYVRQFAAN